jgi:hypothetical protein
MLAPHTVRDRVAFTISAERLRRPAFEVINRMQAHDPSAQLVGTAVALVAMAEAISMDPHDLIARAKNVIATADGPAAPEIKAIRDYAANEIGRGLKL